MAAAAMSLELNDRGTMQYERAREVCLPPAGRSSVAGGPAAVRDHRRELLDVVAGAQLDDRGLIRRPGAAEQCGG